MKGTRLSVSRLELAVVGFAAFRDKVAAALGHGEALLGLAMGRLRGQIGRWASVIVANHATLPLMKGNDAHSLAVAAEDVLTAMRASGIPFAAMLLVVGAVGVFGVLASGTGEPCSCLP